MKMLGSFAEFHQGPFQQAVSSWTRPVEAIWKRLTDRRPIAIGDQQHLDNGLDADRRELVFASRWRRIGGVSSAPARRGDERLVARGIAARRFSRLKWVRFGFRDASPGKV